jgi:hypothetical protein
MKRPPASLIIATAALFVSLGGTGLAASHYLITSTTQIKPDVLRKLEKQGPRGGTGARGQTGAAGVAGPQGPGAIAINFTSSSDTQTVPELVKTIGPLSLYSLCTGGGGTYSVDVVASSPGWTVAGESLYGAPYPDKPTAVSTDTNAPTVAGAFGAGGGAGFLMSVITNGSAAYNLSIALDSGTGTACTWRGTVTPTSG